MRQRELCREDWVRVGRRQVAVGLALFAVFAAFFELVVNISGRDYGISGAVLLAALLILSGLGLLAGTLRADRRR